MKRNVKQAIKTSIKNQILAVNLSILIIVTTVIISISTMLNYQGIVKTLEQTLTETAKTSAGRVTNALEIYRTLAREIASEELFNQPIISEEAYLKGEKGVTEKQLLDKIEGIKNRNQLVEAYIVNKEGVILSGSDISDREYFKTIKETLKPTTSDMIISKETGKMTTIVAAPILKDGVFNGAILLGVDANILSEMVSRIKIGETGQASIMDSEGTLIAHPEQSLVRNEWNAITLSENDPSLKSIAHITRIRMKGEIGFEQYRLSGVKKIAVFAPIENTNGWMIDIALNKNEFMKPAMISIIITSLIGLIALVIAVKIIVKLSNGLSTSIGVVTQAANEIAKGNYDVAIQVETMDESSQLAESMKEMVSSTQVILNDTTRILEQLAKGNFDVKPEAAYIGVFNQIKITIEDIVVKLSNTMEQIKVSSIQVSEGADQVAKGAGSLAQGATEQSSVVEEFVASVEELQTGINANIESVNKTTQIAQRAEEKAEQGVQKMQQLIVAIDGIDKSSIAITDITKVINAIADQTNLLALNAAIEAARAGDLGRGFAVVANEIRELATKSTQAVTNIEQLVKQNGETIQQGKKMVEATSVSLDQIVETVSGTTQVAEELLQTSMLQKYTLNEILKGTNEISQVIEINASNSQESAAISEELLAQAESLKQLTSQFILKKE